MRSRFLPQIARASIQVRYCLRNFRDKSSGQRGFQARGFGCEEISLAASGCRLSVQCGTVGRSITLLSAPRLAVFPVREFTEAFHSTESVFARLFRYSLRKYFLKSDKLKLLRPQRSLIKQVGAKAHRRISFQREISAKTPIETCRI